MHGQQNIKIFIMSYAVTQNDNTFQLV